VLTTKIHALVDALGNPVELMLTPGQDHDLTCAEPLLENADPRSLLGNKASRRRTGDSRSCRSRRYPPTMGARCCSPLCGAVGL
jgi:transposase